MDWQKTKSILILALVATNLILIFNIWGSKSLFADKPNVDSDEWKKVIELIREKSVHYNGGSVLAPEMLKGIKLEYQMYDAEDIAYRLLGNYTEDTGRYKSADGSEVTLELGNKLIYTAKAKPGIGERKPLTDEAAKQLSEAFLAKAMLISSDAKLWDITREGNLTSVIYRQYEDKLFLDDAYMTITLKGNEVVRFERKWFNSSFALDYERQIIHPAKALYRAADQILESGETKPVIIEKLELGYRLDSTSLVTSVKSGEASPYWRVLTKTGNVYYIEAME